MTNPDLPARELFAQALTTAGPNWLPRQRWFGDKARVIEAVEVGELGLAEVDARPVALVIARVVFEDGGNAEYFVPVTVGDTSAPALHRLTEAEPGQGRPVVDALAVPAVRDWLLGCLRTSARQEGGRGAFVWRAGSNSGNGRATAGASRLSAAEQSNSAVIFGDTLLLKVFRKLQPGVNPDIEIGRFLTDRTTFRHLPPLIGDLTFQPSDPDRPDVSLAMAQPFVASQGDGWSVTLARLASELAEGSPAPADALARTLGQRTAQLHLALAGDSTDPDFAPEPIKQADARRWTDDLAAAIARTVADLQARQGDLPIELGERVAALSADDPRLVARRGGFAALVGSVKTRVHGDYHLGQTLVTPDDDILILDFEGEPARPLAERRQKTSPIKDVAGMVRSFGYARGAARRAYAGPLPPEEVERRLRRWEARARRVFLAGYREVVAESAIVPRDAGGFDAAVAAWELDKALYEINYELNNRPDWLEIPLASLEEVAVPAS